MLPGESLLFPVLFELVLAISGTVLTIALAVLYLRYVRLERPAIGTFNRRDIAILFVFIVGLPLLYIVAPMGLLLIFLLLTFMSALSIGLRPLMGPTATWLIVGLLIGANVLLAGSMLGTVLGWQIFWLENSVVVIAAAVTVSNLYVQGGMRVKHVAWFALILAAYDAVFTFVWPITNAAGPALPGLAAGPGHRLPARHLQREPRTGRPPGLLALRDRGAQGLRAPTRGVLPRSSPSSSARSLQQRHRWPSGC